MTKQTEETPVKKSKLTKGIEIFKSLKLNEQEEFLLFAKEIHLTDLKQKEDDLATQLSENQAKQEKLK